MKLLIDENLSHRLVARLDDLYPGSQHVRDIGMTGDSDALIWETAGADGFTIVSKDTDFYQRAVLFGPPPQVIWLRLGNGPISDAERLLRDHHSRIKAFARADETALLALPD